MKANHLFIILSVSILSSIIITILEYTQCQHLFSDESLDLFAISENSLSSLSPLIYNSLILYILEPFLEAHLSQYHLLDMPNLLPAMSELNLSTVSRF